MAVGERFVSDVLELARQAIGRSNANDPASSDEILLAKLNDFVSLSMSNDMRLFENFGTMSFTIDGTVDDEGNPTSTGVYTFNDVGATNDFVTISSEAFISLLDPVDKSVSWNALPIYQDPGEFFSIWGINNDRILIPGYPTMMLYYGNEFTFRTIPDQPYLVKIYGYKKNNNYPSPDVPIQYDYWMRYLAYGLARNYAQDFRYDANEKKKINDGFTVERRLMMAHAHNQIKNSRCLPRY